MSRMARTPRAARAASAHCLKRRADALTLADQAIDERLLPRRGLGLAGPRRKHAGGHARVHHDERVALEDAHEVRIPAHADALAEQRERHRVEGPPDFDVAIGVDGPLASREVRKRVDGERLQRPLLDLDEVRPDLAPRGPVNPQSGDRAIPVPEERIVRVEAVEPPALQGVAFDVPAAALLLAVFLRAARLRRQRREAPVRGEREIDVVAIGIEEARADHGGFEIVVTNDLRHAAEVAKRALVQAKKRLEFLIPDRFLVAVPRMAERHPKHPRPAPLAGRGVERRRAAEEIHLRFGAGRAVKDADRPARRRDRAHEPFHRFVARAVAVLLDQVLPDPLQAQPGVELLGDGRAIERGRESRPPGAGERFGRFCVRAGERFGRI